MTQPKPENIELNVPTLKEKWPYDVLAVQFMLAMLIAIWYGMNRIEVLEVLLGIVAAGQKLTGEDLDLWEPYVPDKYGELMMTFNLVSEHPYRLEGQRYKLTEPIMILIWNLLQVVEDLKPMGTPDEVSATPLVCKLVEAIRLQRNALATRRYSDGVSDAECLVMAIINRDAPKS